MLTKFKYTHLSMIEPREDSETSFNFKHFVSSPAYKDFVNNQMQLYTLFHTLPSGKEVILCIFGGYRTLPGTAELILIPSRYFNRNVLKCLRVLREFIGSKKNEYIPADINRLEMNCNLAYSDIVKFGTKGMKFDIVGIRHKFGFEKQEDYLLLEKVL